MRFYLAYGSNLHPVRMIDRVPSARLVGITHLPGYTVEFVKRGMDRSAKCHLARAQESPHHAYGAVYEIAAREKRLLDAFEGLGRGYDETELDVEVGAEAATVAVFSYVAARSHLAPGLRPFEWYKALVVGGARHHGFPDEYIARLDAVAAQPDPDRERRVRHERFLTELAGHRP